MQRREDVKLVAVGVIIERLFEVEIVADDIPLVDQQGETHDVVVVTQGAATSGHGRVEHGGYVFAGGIGHGGEELCDEGVDGDVVSDVWRDGDESLEGVVAGEEGDGFVELAFCEQFAGIVRHEDTVFEGSVKGDG